MDGLKVEAGRAPGEPGIKDRMPRRIQERAAARNIDDADVGDLLHPDLVQIKGRAPGLAAGVEVLARQIVNVGWIQGAVGTHRRCRERGGGKTLESHPIIRDLDIGQLAEDAADPRSTLIVRREVAVFKDDEVRSA